MNRFILNKRGEVLDLDRLGDGPLPTKIVQHLRSEKEERRKAADEHIKRVEQTVLETGKVNTLLSVPRGVRSIMLARNNANQSSLKIAFIHVGLEVWDQMVNHVEGYKRGYESVAAGFKWTEVVFKGMRIMAQDSLPAWEIRVYYNAQ